MEDMCQEANSSKEEEGGEDKETYGKLSATHVITKDI